MRRRLSLDGPWDFLHVADDSLSGPSETRVIQVPGPWQAQFDDLRMRAGIGIYKREIDIPDDLLGERVWLHVGAAFHNTKAFVNGLPVGHHEGGFLPFAFDITDQLIPGGNEIKLRVDSPTDNPLEFPDTPFAEIPFGKQSWYGPLSGVWQSVYVERRAATHVKHLRLTPERKTGRVDTVITFNRMLDQPLTLRMTVHGPDGAVVSQSEMDIKEGIEKAVQSFHVEDVQSWSPETPHLYRVRVELASGGWTTDCFEDHFGFRTIETKNGKFYLNGEPLYLRAALDQDYYPDGICTTPSVEFLEDQFRKAKAMGLNCLRCHIKAADPRYYEVADRLGLLIWTELPNGGMSTDRSRRRKLSTLKGIVDRDANHPSIIIWTIINENWGVDLVNDPDHRAWLKQTYHWLKTYDPTRLVVDNSPLAPSFHVESDIADYHFYAAIPDHRHHWDAFVDELAGRAEWLYSPEGDAVIRGDEPLMCSEFGNWGLPDPEDLKGTDGKEPWWFETGHDWSEGVMYAHGVQHRFTDWSLDRVFGSLKDFVVATQWQQFRALKYEIEAMRRKEALSGYVITELTDCHWEANGLMDMRRNPRVFHEALRDINADTVIVPQWERLTYWEGETMRLALAVAHGAGHRLEGCTLEVALDGSSTRLPLPAIDPATVFHLDAVDVRVPAVRQARMQRLEMRLVDGQGHVLAVNHLDVAVHPARMALPYTEEPAWSPDAPIRDYLEALGYRMAPALEDASLIVSKTHDAAIAAHVRNGAHLVLLPEAGGTLYPFFPHWQNVKILERTGTPWSGDWASSFAWLKRGRMFAGLPGGPLLDESFDRVIPDYVMSGCNLLDFQARVQAGLVVGWIHKPVALAVERSYGKGRLAASTFRLFRDAPLADPTATTLFDSLVALAFEARAPRMEEAAKAAEAAA